MNKIVLSLLTLSFSGFVYSQAATAWSGEKKIGEYRKNPVTGNIEYYETNNKPKYSAPVYDTSYLQELAERRTAIANHYTLVMHREHSNFQKTVLTMHKEH